MTTTRKKSAFCFTEKKKGIPELTKKIIVFVVTLRSRREVHHPRRLVPREGQHQPARVLFGNKNGQSTLSRFSILLVSVARSALSGGTRCRRAFSVTSIDEKGTTKDAKRRAPRRGATRREKVDREATRRKRAYFSATFFRARRKGNDETRAWHTRSETSRRFWVGIPGVSGPLVSGADLFLLSLSLSLSFIVALFKNTQIGKTKITLPPPKEIAKYACYILGLWAFVAGLFGALLSISVQMRQYKYRSLPQKFIGKFKYGDTADITYPTYSRGLYPWIAASAPCELTTDSNPNSYVNNDVTLWPTCVPADTVSNPNRFPVDANCGRACQNP